MTAENISIVESLSVLAVRNICRQWDSLCLLTYLANDNDIRYEQHVLTPEPEDDGC